MGEKKIKKDNVEDGSSNIFSGKNREMFGFSLFGSNKSTLLKLIQYELKKNNKIWVATVNPEFIMETEKDKRFFDILKNKTTVNVVDGIGLEWGRKVLSTKYLVLRIGIGFRVGIEILFGKNRETLITGADLMNDFCSLAERLNKTVAFYGGWNNRAEKTAQYFLKKYPKLIVVDFRAEDFDFKIKTDFMFVARAMKKQEFWIEDNWDKLNIGVVMGVGRSFDYYSGALTRAPKWVRKMGMEWLFSLVVDPKRWKRQLALPRFIWKVLFS